MWNRSFLILHGVENRRPAGHWQHELALALRGRGEQVFYPQLPDTDRPSLEAWVEAILAELALMRGEKVVVCHSLASTAWLHVAAAAPAAADRLLLVSPPGPAAFDWDVIAGFDPAGLDLGGLELAAQTPRLACSDDDPYCAEGAAETYGAPLGCDVDVLPGAGHLALDDGYGPWPAALAWCLDPAERLAPNR
ncbi:RBBP9/YdeN family alpha/beta hydrolase [Glycomyces terrestris]|uniref:Hydrolase n=1 Tax=Glycomyces terrestris TaxID=2493553 RepID=A0A426UZT5_9ACTN|nr:alpha/beta hydrolase [Glycomyces terrestris]RRS00114.1 hydrolase [Glycomyces terrestris]